MRIAWLSLVLAVGSVACGGSDPAPSDPADSATDGVTDGVTDGAIESDASAPADGAVDTASKPDVGSPETPAACNALDNVADVVTSARVAEALPTLAGGTVSDGTYVVTAVTEYTGVGGASGPKTGTTMKQTLLLSAGKFAIVRQQNGGAAKRSSGSFGTAGTTFTLGGECPTPGDVPLQYEATSTTLKISLGATLKEVITYTKR